jgi:hypothetical protein
VVAGNHAGDRLLVGHRLADAEADLAAGAKPPAARRMVEFDRDRADAATGRRYDGRWTVLSGVLAVP